MALFIAFGKMFVGREVLRVCCRRRRRPFLEVATMNRHGREGERHTQWQIGYDFAFVAAKLVRKQFILL